LCVLAFIAFMVVLYVYVLCYCVVFFFFFSSRRRHTRFKCDWSSDVCSSDLFSCNGGRRCRVPALDWKSNGRTCVQDGGGRSPLVSTRRGRPGPPPLHAPARPHRSGGERDRKSVV